MGKGSDRATSGPRSRRTVITMAGVLYGLTTLFLAVGAVNGQNNLLFWAFGLAMGGMLVSGVMSGTGMMGLRVRRRVPAQARAGEAFTISYELTNANRVVPLYCVTLVERAEGSGVLARPATGFTPRVGAGQIASASVRAVPASRGRLTLESVSASSSFPLGVMRKVVEFEARSSTLVLPARLRLRPSLLPRPARRGYGGAASPTGTGHGEEFYSVRTYVPGDSPRLIAWRPSARGEELIVRQHGTPPPTIAWVILEFIPEAPGLEIERAIALAAAAIEALAAKGCSVGLLCEGLDVVRAPAPGPWHAQRLLGALASLDVGAKSAATARRGEAVRVRPEHAAIVVRGCSAGAAATWGASAPAWATALESFRIRDYLAEGFALPAVLEDPPAPESRDARWRRLMREFFLVDPVGDVSMEGAGSSGAGRPASPRGVGPDMAATPWRRAPGDAPASERADASVGGGGAA